MDCMYHSLGAGFTDDIRNILLMCTSTHTQPLPLVCFATPSIFVYNRSDFPPKIVYYTAQQQEQLILLMNVAQTLAFR